MPQSSSTSLLAVLSLYISLRRSGSNEVEAQNKVRTLTAQLSADDRRQLVKAAQDWEAQHGKQVDQERAKNDFQRAAMVMSPQAASIYGTSEYDSISTMTDATALQPLHSFVTCSSCGAKNEGDKKRCSCCGQLLQSIRVTSATNEEDPSWFGPNSRLVLTATGKAPPLEIRVRSIMTLGRHTPEEAKADIDLMPYGADTLGVSRLHACIQWQHYGLILGDMNSKYHTFLNGKQLQQGEWRTLTNGDTVRLGGLDLSVTFEHDN